MGLIHLDAGVIIGFLNRSDVHHQPSWAVLAEALSGGDRLAMAASAFAEILVGPARRGEAEILIVQTLMDRLPIAIIDINGEIATVAARLRSKHPVLRPPDALVIATAVVDSADQLVTTDKKWPTASALQMEPVLKQI
jgi:predicted nucleic acid-binding protein